MTESRIIDHLIEARWVIPVLPRGLVLEQVAVAITRGEIIAVLPIADARLQFRPGKVTRLPHHALIPGLINLHTHAAMSLMRGLADDLPLMDWLNQRIWPAEARAVSERFVRDGTLLACTEMLRGGITCFNDMYFFPMAAGEAVDRSGMRACLGMVMLDAPSPYAADADDYLHKGLLARDMLREHGRITTCLAPHAPYTVSDRTFEKVLTYADQLGLGLHLHLHETRDEIAQSEVRHGLRPLQRLAALGLPGPNMTAAHCVHLTQGEIDLLAAQGCHVAHCPTSNLKLGSGIAPVAALSRAGVNVGLGTDGAASNNRLDIFAEMRLAALLAKAEGDAACLPVAEALEMATINGAKALGMDHLIGSIEPGKLADLVAIDFSSIEMMPCYDPLSHLVHVVGREQVSHTWVNGDLCFERGVYDSVEAGELKEIVSVWQGRLK